MTARSDRYYLIDALRGLGALLVLAAHSAASAGALADGAAIRPYQARFEVALAIFFTASGFLLYRPFVKARLRDLPALSVRAYAWRRFLRIVPAFWVTLTVVAIWLGISGLFTPGHIATYYGFAQIYRSSTIGGVIPQAWTLCIEAAFYLVLPLYAVLMRRLPGHTPRTRLRGELIVVGVLVAGSLAYNAALVFGGAVDRITYKPVPALAMLPGYMDQIAIGMGLAILSVWLEKREALPPALALGARFPSLCWLAAGVAFWVAATRIGLTGRPGELYTPAQYMERHVLNAFMALAVMVPAIFGNPRKGLTRRLLGNPLFVYVGLICYGFYLFHVAVIDQLIKWDFASVHLVHPYIQWTVAATLGTLLLGSLSYFLVERPALKLKRLVRPPGPAGRGEAVVEAAPPTPVTVRPGG